MSNYFLGPLLFVVVAGSLYKQVQAQPDLGLRWAEVANSWHSPLLWAGALLMPINYGIEARKWQILVRHTQPFSFWQAIKSVFAGCSITMLTPNRIGEYGGRILFLLPENRLKAILLTVLGSIAQLLITLLIGIGGLTYFIFFGQSTTQEVFTLLPVFASEVVLVLLIIFTALLVVVYLNEGAILYRFERYKRFEKILGYVRVLEEFKKTELLRLLFLSLARYFVFVAQFILMLKAMDVQLPLVLSFWLLGIFYLAMAVVPTIGFTELPVRAATSAGLFGIFNNNILGIQAATLSIWLINLILPAIIGSIFISAVKLYKERK